MDNLMTWVEIYVQDMKRAKNFYETVLGTKLEKLETPMPGMEMWTFPMAMDKYGAGGALVKIDGCPSGGNSTLVYFGCKDCAVEESRIVKAGGKIHRSKMSIGQYGWITLGYDTEGNMFGLHTPPANMSK